MQGALACCLISPVAIARRRGGSSPPAMREGARSPTYIATHYLLPPPNSLRVWWGSVTLSLFETRCGGIAVFAGGDFFAGADLASLRAAALIFLLIFLRERVFFINICIYIKKIAIFANAIL